MSYFRNFSKAVSSYRFWQPNNLVIRSTLSKILCQAPEPSIEHLHTSKALFRTISTLAAHKQGLNDSNYKKEIQTEMEYLEKASKQYQASIKKFVENNGKLTGEGIANIYASARELGLSSQWLKSFVLNEVPVKAAYMSRCNLQDVIAGIKQHHGGSQYMELLEGLLRQKEALGKPEYVEYYGKAVNRFEYCDAVPSDNLLIHAVQSNTMYPIYFMKKTAYKTIASILSYKNKQPGYKLHNLQ